MRDSTFICDNKTVNDTSAWNTYESSMIETFGIFFLSSDTEHDILCALPCIKKGVSFCIAYLQPFVFDVLT